jgi:anthranilate phosphoribosyltransferase
MNIQQAIKAVTEDHDLSREEMESVMREIMTGAATPAQIGGFLIGLRMKGETIDEITAAASVMRSLATRVEVDLPHLVDTCGTGGDSSGTFNVSTASAFVAAAAGAHVAKHGNRSVSSRSGSADLLEAAGIRIDLDAAQVAACIREVGVGFMFAPLHHGAMKHAIGPRREMGVRTIFNLLGPLSNPAMAPNQVLGVFSENWVEPLARVLGGLGSEHVLVVHAEDGLDEISVAAPTLVAELREGEVSTRTVTPEELGVARGKLDDIVVSSAEASLALIRRAFANEAGAARDIVALNGGAAIYAAGLADSLNAGVARAFDVLADGSAADKLDQLAAFSNGL